MLKILIGWQFCCILDALCDIVVATYVTAFDEFSPKQLKFVECEGNLITQIEFHNVGKFQILIVILREKKLIRNT